MATEKHCFVFKKENTKQCKTQDDKGFRRIDLQEVGKQGIKSKHIVQRSEKIEKNKYIQKNKTF